MTTITITREVAKGAKVVFMPPEEYKEYSRWKKAMTAQRTFQPTKEELNDLEEARKEYRRGKTMTINELKQKLGFGN